jgi:hypothetical protein
MLVILVTQDQWDQGVMKEQLDFLELPVFRVSLG